MTHGADLSALSLAAASMRVKHIEETFGSAIFRRGRNGISLTPAGESFLAHAHAILLQLDRMRIDLNAYAEGVKGRLRLLANTTSKAILLPKVLPAFLASHPDVDIELREARSRTIVKALHEGTADVGIVSAHVSTEGLATWPYYVDRMVLVASERHPLARRRSVSFAEALEHDFIGGNPDSALHAFVLEYALATGRRFKQRIQVGTFDEMCHLIEQGIGVGVLPLLALPQIGRRVRPIEIEDSWSVQPLTICVRDPDVLPDFARALVDFLVADAEANAPMLRPR